MYIQKEMNLKIFYNFVEFNLKAENYNLPHERYKKIIFDEYIAESEEEIYIKSFSDAYYYMVNNINQVITKDFLKTSYYILSKCEIDNDLANEIVYSLYKEKDQNIYYLAAKIHMLIFKYTLDNYKNFALLLSNYLVFKKTGKLIILYKNYINEYKNIIQENDENKLAKMFCEISKKPEKKNSLVFTAEEIDLILKDSYKDLIRDFNIDKLYLYGSIVKGTQNNYSDVDFLVIFNNNLSKYERDKRRVELCNFFEEKLKSSVDVIDFTSALKCSDIREMERIITLI